MMSAHLRGLHLPRMSTPTCQCVQAAAEAGAPWGLPGKGTAGLSVGATHSRGPVGR